jgi:hypothetical protein
MRCLAMMHTYAVGKMRERADSLTRNFRMANPKPHLSNPSTKSIRAWVGNHLARGSLLILAARICFLRTKVC